MSFYKILEEITEITRFQLVQKAKDKLELRIVAMEHFTFIANNGAYRKFLLHS